MAILVYLCLFFAVWFSQSLMKSVSYCFVLHISCNVLLIVELLIAGSLSEPHIDELNII